MKCPKCATPNSGVKNSRSVNDETMIRRRRCCVHPGCGYRWSTYEVLFEDNDAMERGVLMADSVIVIAPGGRVLRVNLRRVGETLDRAMFKAFGLEPPYVRDHKTPEILPVGGFVDP